MLEKSESKEQKNSKGKKDKGFLVDNGLKKSLKTTNFRYFSFWGIMQMIYRIYLP